jgi:hypothetical protein
MNERDSFFHEVRVLLHIEQMKSKCNYTSQVGSLINVNVDTYTITTQKLGRPLHHHHNKSEFLGNVSLIRQFFDCVGVTHCDASPKNFGVIDNLIYVFDMDISYITAGGRPTGMSCKCTLHKPCLT